MTWELIEQVDLAEPASSIVFDEGLEGYVFYRLTVYALNDGSAGTPFLRINGDDGTNYDYQSIAASATTPSGSRSTSQDEVFFVSSGASDAASAQLLIAKPAAAMPAQVIILAGYDSSPVLELRAVEWGNVADLISSIEVARSAGGSFAAGTSVILEGLAI